MQYEATPKRVIVHVGPHKTGSTAIQKSLAGAAEKLAQAGMFFLSGPLSHDAALSLAGERFEEAEQLLARLSAAISNVDQPCVILSQEDFSGALIGRSRKRQVYPKLTRNLRVLKRGLRPHHVEFVFFLREKQAWLRSCYHQHLKYRTRFWRHEDFVAEYGEFSWEEKLAKPTQTFGAALRVVAHSADPAAGVTALLAAAMDGAAPLALPVPERINRSPSATEIAQLERINELSEFAETSWFSKSLILSRGSSLPEPDDTGVPDWPPRAPRFATPALPALAARVAARVAPQDGADILPEETVDLGALADRRLPREVEMPEVARADIRDQARILEYHLRGKSALNHLNALCISYLRRDTPHTQKARLLFHRIWREQGVLLVNELSTRWLISTLQTFLDHGLNEAQRSIGTAGFFYANMMKIYEGERAIEGLEPAATYPALEHTTKSKFRGLDRYKVGGSDLMLNTNAMALEIAQRDPVAGVVLQELLLRVKAAETVFSRHDRTRREQGITVPGFENTWSFFDPPAD